MEAVMHVPAILKILCLFSLIVILYRIKVPLWAALLAASLLSGLWFGAPVVKTLKFAGRSAVSVETLFLCAVVVLIMSFSTMMESAGVLKRIVSAFSALLGKSLYSGAALPALIGLLPMPGGAVFSAPMVEAACGAESAQTQEQKSAINYWFRHIWEYWWPLYPGIILASSLFSISSWKLFTIHFPLTIVSATAGYFFILRPSFREEKSLVHVTETKNGGSLWRTIAESASIVIVILSIFIAGPILALLNVKGITSKYWPVIIGMILGMFWLAIRHKMSAAQIAKCMLTKSQISMLLMAAGVMMFRDVLQDVNAFELVQGDLQIYHVPPIVVIAALPFLSGFILGLAVGFVGASFPLVISLLPLSVIHSDARFAYLTLAYSCAYVGMILSPVHLCLIMTKDYFNADLLGIYKKMLLPCLFILITGVTLFFLYLKIL
jgi:uncharacterized protein